MFELDDKECIENFYAVIDNLIENGLTPAIIRLLTNNHLYTHNEVGREIKNRGAKELAQTILAFLSDWPLSRERLEEVFEFVKQEFEKHE